MLILTGPNFGLVDIHTLAKAVHHLQNQPAMIANFNHLSNCVIVFFFLGISDFLKNIFFYFEIY
jgi:hypothetical protein